MGQSLVIKMLHCTTHYPVSYHHYLYYCTTIKLDCVPFLTSVYFCLDHFFPLFNIMAKTWTFGLDFFFPLVSCLNYYLVNETMIDAPPEGEP